MDKLMQHKLDELHLTQLNLVLLNNFYKQIYEGGKCFKLLSPLSIGCNCHNDRVYIG